jgi:drug/metabolite transporter (DMT)-like permease
MRQIAGGNAPNPLALLAAGIEILTNPWIILGVVCLILALLFYLAAISRLDLSYVLPMSASSYVLSTLCAWSILGERISATRWAGTIMVTIGVLLVGLSEGKSKGGKAGKSVMLRSRSKRKDSSFREKSQ